MSELLHIGDTVFFDVEEKNEEAFVKPEPRAGTVVALTGASGFIGSHVAEALLRDGHTVRAVVRDKANAESDHAEKVHALCVKRSFGRLESPAQVAARKGGQANSINVESESSAQRAECAANQCVAATTTCRLAPSSARAFSTWRLARPSAQAFSTWRLARPSARAFSTWRFARPSAQAFSKK